MERDLNGFLVTANKNSSSGAKGHVTSSSSLEDNDEGYTKSPSNEHDSWLDDFRDMVCMAARFPDGLSIPEPFRAAFNVCVNKSGLSKVFPNAIAEDRKGYIERFHTTVYESARRKVPSDASGVGPEVVEGHELPSSIYYETPYPTNGGLSIGSAMLSASRAHVYTPDKGLTIAGVILPAFILLYCLRNVKFTRRLCSCMCCIRTAFKPSKKPTAQTDNTRWRSGGDSSIITPEPTARMFVPRRTLFGLRYLVLLAPMLVVGVNLVLGTYSLVDLHAVLYQLACVTGQAASTVINGQTLNEASEVQSYTTASLFLSPYLAPSPFSVGAPIHITEEHSPLLSSGGIDRAAHLYGKVQGRTATRILQAESKQDTVDVAPPKRNGFIGVVPALNYFESLLVTFDSERPDSLPRELRNTADLAGRVKQSVNEIKRSMGQLREVLYNPMNHGSSLPAESSPAETRREATYHFSLVSAAAASLLSSWETLVHLLPQGVSTISEASDTVALNIESSLSQLDNLPEVEQLHAVKAAIAESLAYAQGVLEPVPGIRDSLFWGSVVAFFVLTSVILLASLYLCCLCCCKKNALVDKKGTSFGCSVLMLLVAAASFVLCGGLLVATTILTDGCLYTRGYVKKAGDIDDLFEYFGTGKDLAFISNAGSEGPSTTSKVLAACLLPDEERDLVRVLGIGDLVEKGEKIRTLSTTTMSGEALAALLLSLQVREAAQELRLVEDTYWLFLLDPMALEEAGLEERLFTYPEVLCSGIQDKQRAVKASYLGFTLSTSGEGPQAQSSSGPLLWQQEDWRPEAELAGLLEELTEDRAAAERLAASLQQKLVEMQLSSSTSSGDPAKLLVGGLLSDVLELIEGKTEAQKVQLLQTVVRLAGRAYDEIQADRSSTGSKPENAKRRREQKKQRTMLLKLLHDTCMQGAPSDKFWVFGMEDVEARIAPFSLSSLNSSSSSDSKFVINSTFDPDAPVVADVAATKDTPEEQRRFANAVWWAARKERLRAEGSQPFVCPGKTPADNAERGPQGGFCSFTELQENTHKVIRKLHTQLEGLWADLRVFFESRSRVFRLLGQDHSDAAANLDCRIVRTEAEPIAELVCDRARVSGANVAFVLLLLGCAACLLLPCFCCLWRVGVENKWRQREAEIRSSRRRESTSIGEDSHSPTLINAPMPHNNAAAAAACAAACAATAAAASDLAAQPMPHRQQSRRYSVRDSDWR